MPEEPGAAELGALHPKLVAAFREQGFAVVADAEGMPGTLRVAGAPSVQAVPASDSAEAAVAHARMRELGLVMADTRLAQTLRAVATLVHGRYGSAAEAQVASGPGSTPTAHRAPLQCGIDREPGRFRSRAPPSR